MVVELSLIGGVFCWLGAWELELELQSTAVRIQLKPN
jgi:hypothetical protein